MSSERILLVASEVAPFTDTELGRLVRALPEALSDGGADVRLMMPRYGSIDDFKNGLHEVIRLSGTEIPMGEDTETLTVKVGRVPETRLQVYFMDHEGYFDRTGHYGSDEAIFADNLERAFFFGRSVLETLCKLRWGPDVIHSLGAMSALVPHLLRTEYLTRELFEQTATAYTPEPSQEAFHLNVDRADALGLALDGSSGQIPHLPALGARHAEATFYPSFQETRNKDDLQIDAEAPGDSVVTLYENALREVPA